MNIKDAIFRRKRLHADFATTFGTEEGKRVLSYICKIGYVSTTTFNPTNPEKTLLNEGSRLLALAILNHTHKQPVEEVTESILEGNYGN